MKSVKVSVILPTCGREWELKRALESIAAQDFPDFEIIIVDDNDDKLWNDKVKQIAADIKEQHPDLEISMIENHPRLGSARARNMGIAAAKGEFITFLDDDDEYLEGKIENQYSFMVDHCLDYSITDLDLYFDNGRLSEHRRHTYIKNTDPDSLLEYHLMYHMTGTDTMMFRKNYLEKIKGFAHFNVGDEFYLMQRAIEARGKFGYLPRCDVRAYVHTGEGGLSSGETKISGENRLYAYKKQYFRMLPQKSIRYIKMRHYSVLAFACMRMRNFRKFLIYGMLGVLMAPFQCVKMLIDRKKKNCDFGTEKRTYESIDCQP